MALRNFARGGDFLDRAACRPSGEKTVLTGKIIVLAAAIVLAVTGASWGFGFTFGQNPYTEGPFYSYNPPDIGAHCTWQRKWVTDKNGRRVLRRHRVCH